MALSTHQNLTEVRIDSGYVERDGRLGGVHIRCGEGADDALLDDLGYTREDVEWRLNEFVRGRQQWTDELQKMWVGD